MEFNERFVIWATNVTSVLSLAACIPLAVLLLQ